jgi:hypothetical protein
MTIDRRAKLKFVSWALMLAVAATLATRAWAAEDGSQPSGDAKANNSETQSRDSSAIDKNAAPVSSGVDTEDVDTRITVQPHAPAGKPGKVGGTANPIQPLKLVNPHRRTFSPSRAGNRIAPNALGVLNGQRQILRRGGAEHFEPAGVRPTLPIGTGAQEGSLSAGLTKPEHNIGRRPIFPSTGISSSGAGAKAFNRGGIGGPGSTHYSLGANSSGIGGPARAATGINGTLIRATH